TGEPPPPRPSWRWPNCCSIAGGRAKQWLSWSISFLPIPRAPWCRRHDALLTRRVARCPRHETPRVPGPDRRRPGGALTLAPSAAELGQGRVLADDPDGRCPGRAPQGVRRHLSIAGARRPGRLAAHLSQRL